MMGDVPNQPQYWEFPSDALLNDGCRAYRDPKAVLSRQVGDHLCHLLDGHRGDHWNDHAKTYWNGPDILYRVWPWGNDE